MKKTMEKGKKRERKREMQKIFAISKLIHVMSLKEESGRFFFHFREIFEKSIEYIGKFMIHFREILNLCGSFKKKFVQFTAHFLESP